MLTIEEIKNDLDLINAIDWEMTPEEAVRLYLEWGNNWAGGNYVIRSKDDVSHYFIVNTWGEVPVLNLIRRNSEQAVELAVIDLPDSLKQDFLDSVGHNRGVYAIDDEIKKWLHLQLGLS